MRSKLTVLCSLFVLALPLHANEKPSDAYQQAMKGLQTATNTMRNHVKNIDYPGLEKDADSFKASFAAVLPFWEERKVEDAIKFAQDGMKGADALAVAAKAQNYNDALAAQNAISGSNGVAFNGDTALPGVCVGCHLAHRQRMPDGTFEIK
jgi:hypothetical protein